MALSNFNSRPREGANAVIELKDRGYIISIPAPVRGRTGNQETEEPEEDFNSRPREGANPLHSIRPRRQR